MIEILKKIIDSGGSDKLKKIQLNSSLLSWIDENCSSDLFLYDCPSENLLQKKIYTCLKPETSVRCQLTGSWLRFIAFTLPLRCRQNCKCFLNCKIAKSKQTCLKIYGAENPQQNNDVRNKTKKTNLEKNGYETPFHSTDIQEKIKLTNRLLYSVENQSQRPEVKDKKKQKALKRYGVEYTLQSPEIRESIKNTIQKKYRNSHYTLSHLSLENLEILQSPILLKDSILTFGFKGTADKLCVSFSTVYNYHKKYNLNLLSPFCSAAEAEISTWLTSLNIKHELNNRTICKPKEIDIYIPEYKLAIEFDGLYWHAESVGKGKYYHQEKTKKCAEQGIQLLHIFEDEWLQKKDICKNIIGGYLNQHKTRIPARKCSVVELKNSEVKGFLDKNHLQGNLSATINIALTFNDEIISLITFRKPRYNKKIQWELLRLSIKNDIQVIGGTQKLWHFFIEKYKPTSVVSYCDLRWFSGKIYEKLGFKRDKSASPTYWYTDYETRFHRSKFTKKAAVNVASQFLTIDELQNLTENQITKDILGLDRVWDCGQDTWIWRE